MDRVRESSQKLMARLVQTLLDEGVTAEAFDLGSMPFAAMEMLGHGLGKVLARQIRVALAEAQAARIQEQQGGEHDCPLCGRARRPESQPRTLQTLDSEIAKPKEKLTAQTCEKLHDMETMILDATETQPGLRVRLEELAQRRALIWRAAIVELLNVPADEAADGISVESVPMTEPMEAQPIPDEEPKLVFPPTSRSQSLNRQEVSPCLHVSPPS